MSLRDESFLTPRRATLLTYVLVGLFVLLSAGRLAGDASVPWGVVVGSGVATGVVAGPVAWVARDRLPAERRATLGQIGAAAALLVFMLLLGVSLAFVEIPFLSMTDAVTVGVGLGGAVALLAERTVVPERYRAKRA